MCGGGWEVRGDTLARPRVSPGLTGGKLSVVGVGGIGGGGCGDEGLLQGGLTGVRL